LVLLDDEPDEPASRASISAEVAEQRGIKVTRLRADGASAYERLASLVGLVDYASVYLAIGSGIDPTPVAPIDALKQRLVSLVAANRP
jgi:glucose/mannose-6-phosphate isomerase